MKTHKDLDVWKKSIDFVTHVYEVTKGFPKDEQYGLSSQIRRASVSIPSNIAEGATRKGKTEFRHFLYIAMASSSEIETQLIISFNLKYITIEQQEQLQKELDIIARMIQGLIRSVTSN